MANPSTSILGQFVFIKKIYVADKPFQTFGRYLNVFWVSTCKIRDSLVVVSTLEVRKYSKCLCLNPLHDVESIFQSTEPGELLQTVIPLTVAKSCKSEK